MRSISFFCAVLSNSPKPPSHFLPLLLPNLIPEFYTRRLCFLKLDSSSIYCNWASCSCAPQMSYLPNLPVFLLLCSVIYISSTSLPLPSQHRSLALLLLLTLWLLLFPSISNYCFTQLLNGTIPQASLLVLFLFLPQTYGWFYHINILCIYITSSVFFSFRLVFPTTSSLLQNNVRSWLRPQLDDIGTLDFIIRKWEPYRVTKGLNEMVNVKNLPSKTLGLYVPRSCLWSLSQTLNIYP